MVYLLLHCIIYNSYCSDIVYCCNLFYLTYTFMRYAMQQIMYMVYIIFKTLFDTNSLTHDHTYIISHCPVLPCTVLQITKGYKEEERYTYYKQWFTNTAALIFRKLPLLGYAIFLQSDIRVILSGNSDVTDWVDKGVVQYELCITY